MSYRGFAMGPRWNPNDQVSGIARGLRKILCRGKQAGKKKPRLYCTQIKGEY